MQKKLKHIIIYSFQSLEDPLLKGLMLEYLIRINSNQHIFHLISHEQKQFKLTTAQKKLKKKFLCEKNINWYPINYYSGKFTLIKKLYNFIQSYVIAIKIKLKHQPEAIVGFLSIAGAYSYIISKFLKIPLVVFCFEPHSQYMIDFNVWDKKSIKYKLLNKFEILQLKHAQHITLPTKYSIELANSINPNNKKYYLPISVDTDLFKFSIEHRNTIRNQLQIGNNIVIIYTGKFGGIYYNASKTIHFFKQLLEQYPNYYFLVITPNEDEVRAEIIKQQIPTKNYHINKPVAYEKLSQYLSAADIGLLAVPPLPSQKYRTPVKTGLYLSCGLPYLVNKGISEDDIIALNEGIGIVIDDFENTDYKKLSHDIIELTRKEPKQMKEKCRNYAIHNRSIDLSVNILKNILSNITR